MSPERYYPRMMNAVDFDKILTDQAKLESFFVTTAGRYVMIEDQSIKSAKFDNMSIVLAKASDHGFRVLQLNTVFDPSGLNVLRMYALLERTN